MILKHETPNTGASLSFISYDRSHDSLKPQTSNLSISKALQMTLSMRSIPSALSSDGHVVLLMRALHLQVLLLPHLPLPPPPSPFPPSIPSPGLGHHPPPLYCCTPHPPHKPRIRVFKKKPSCSHLKPMPSFFAICLHHFTVTSRSALQTLAAQHACCAMQMMLRGSFSGGGSGSSNSDTLSISRDIVPSLLLFNPSLLPSLLRAVFIYM